MPYFFVGIKACFLLDPVNNAFPFRPFGGWGFLGEGNINAVGLWEKVQEEGRDSISVGILGADKGLVLPLPIQVSFHPFGQTYKATLCSKLALYWFYISDDHTVINQYHT